MSNLLETILGTAILSGMFYLAGKQGNINGRKEVYDKIREDEIAELKRQLNELKRKMA